MNPDLSFPIEVAVDGVRVTFHLVGEPGVDLHPIEAVVHANVSASRSIALIAKATRRLGANRRESRQLIERLGEHRTHRWRSRK